MAFSQSFTGKGTGIELPQGSAVQAQQGLNEMVLNADKLRYETFRKNQEEFLKNMNVDPGFVISDSARKYMVKRLDEFKTKYGKIAQEKNYNLSIDDKLNMQTDRNLIEAEKNDQLSQYELWQQHRDLVAKNPNRYDADKFAEATGSYMKEGRYNLTMPPIKAVSFSNFIKEQAGKSQEQYVLPNSEVLRRGSDEGIPWRTVEDLGKFIENNLFVNDQATIGLLEDWEKETPEIKNKFLLDTDNSGKIDAIEQKNAIVEWAKQNPKYLKEAEVIKYRWGNVPIGRGAATSGFNTKAVVGPSNNKNKDYDVQTYSTKIGTGRVDLPNTLIFPLETPKISTLTISKKYSVDANGNMIVTPLKNSETADFDIVGYNPDKDILIAKAVKDSDQFNEGETVLLDASTYDKQLTQKLKLWRGSLKKEVKEKPSTPPNVIDVSSIFGGKQDSTKPVR